MTELPNRKWSCPTLSKQPTPLLAISFSRFNRTHIPNGQGPRVAVMIGKNAKAAHARDTRLVPLDTARPCYYKTKAIPEIPPSVLHSKVGAQGTTGRTCDRQNQNKLGQSKLYSWVAWDPHSTTAIPPQDGSQFRTDGRSMLSPMVHCS